MSLLTSAVAAVIVDPVGRVLLCQQSQGHRLWGLPGGKIRNGESPIHAVVRDVLEETGADAVMLDRLAAVLNRDLDNTIQRAETIAKPVIILALGAVVALVAAAVYQPLIEMYNRI